MPGLFIGDSIALGLSMAHPGQTTVAVVGRSPAAIASHPPPPARYPWAVISAGSNNTPGKPMGAHLAAIRAAVTADCVVWVLPANPQNRAQVSAAAMRSGDPTVSFTPGRDRVHPRSYSALWRRVVAALCPNRRG